MPESIRKMRHPLSHVRLLVGLLLFSLAACVRTPQATAPANKYADATLRQIGTAQDERNTAALLPFLTHSNADYRREAALALASVQAPTAVPALLPLLRDTNASVRRAAAYALGQTGDSTAVDSLRVRVLREPDAVVRRYAHEALGRCVTRRTLPELWRVETGNDTARAAARAWGLCRAAIRGLHSPEAIRRAVLLLNTPRLNSSARFAAATALARTRGLDADLARLAGTTLLRLTADDPYYAVRAACATALGKAAVLTPAAPAALVRLATSDADYRVRVAAVRALPFTAETYAGSRAAVGRALRDTEPVALVAAEWLLAHAIGESSTNLVKLTAEIRPWRVQYTVLAAAIRVAAPTDRDAAGKPFYEREKAQRLSAYQTGYLLQALGEDASPTSYTLVKEAMALHQKSPVVMGYGLAALVAMRRSPAFPAKEQGDFTLTMRQALASDDITQISAAAEALADPKATPNPHPDDLTALHQAQARLQLPHDIEAWQSIQTALDKLEKAPKPTPAPIGTAGQHPIDWAVVQSIPAKQRVRLRTTQGDIVLELKVNDAPGTVARFVTLVRQHFYDSLYFHRVIPNFVAQGGDPRGDGSGSAPYTLRSEFGDLRYEEGSVGLASAGKDTESCQFFIAHLPTPHLDGRYPIFAQVVSGMAAVHKLQIGDRIWSAELLRIK